MKCSIMLHFFWVFIVCKSTHLGVTRIQRVQCVLQDLNLTIDSAVDKIHKLFSFCMVPVYLIQCIITENKIKFTYCDEIKKRILKITDSQN